MNAPSEDLRLAEYRPLFDILSKASFEKDGYFKDISFSQVEYVNKLCSLFLKDLTVETVNVRAQLLSTEKKLKDFTISKSSGLLGVLRYVGPIETELTFLKERLEQLKQDLNELRKSSLELMSAPCIVSAVEEVLFSLRSQAQYRESVRKRCKVRELLYYGDFRKAANLLAESDGQISKETCKEVQEYVIWNLRCTKSFPLCLDLVEILERLGMTNKEICLKFITEKYPCILVKINKLLPGHLIKLVKVFQQDLFEMVKQYILMFCEKESNILALSFCASNLFKIFKEAVINCLFQCKCISEIIEIRRLVVNLTQLLSLVGLNMFPIVKKYINEALSVFIEHKANSSLERIKFWISDISKEERTKLDFFFKGITKTHNLPPVLAILHNSFCKTLYALGTTNAEYSAQIVLIWTRTLVSFSSLVKLVLADVKMTEDQILKTKKLRDSTADLVFTFNKVLKSFCTFEIGNEAVSEIDALLEDKT